MRERFAKQVIASSSFPRRRESIGAKREDNGTGLRRSWIPAFAGMTVGVVEV